MSADQPSGELTLFPLDSHARTSPWRDVVTAWLEHGRGSGGKSPESWLRQTQPGSSQKTSLDSCQQTTDGQWEPSSGRWQNSGWWEPGECWTLNTSESRNDDAASSSLRDVLEPLDRTPSKYLISPAGAAGILDRAGRRGRRLPADLAEALRTAARSER